MNESGNRPVADVFELNSRLFRNCLVGLSEAEGQVRPNQHTNNVAFIAGHLVESRAWMARQLGVECPAPFGGVLEHARSLAEVTALPTLASIRSEWDDTSGIVLARLAVMTAADFAAPSPQRMPGVADTIRGLVDFLGHHESYHIGQLAYLRKYLGFPAMSYR